MTPAPLFEKPNPIQPNELAAYQSALQSTQGNILKSHGRKQTINVFLTFTGDPDKLKAAIHELAPSVTSAFEQSRQIKYFKDCRKDTLFVGFGLSSEGYARLGYDPTRFKSDEFVGGMARPNSGLGDSPTSSWEPKYRAPL